MDKTAARAASWVVQQRRAYWLGLLPALCVLALVTLVPVMYLLVTSLTPASLTNPGSAGDFSQPARNYVDAFADRQFIASLWLQAQLSVATVSAQLLLGLGFALLLNTRTRVMRVIRSAFLVPMVLPPIVVALIWKVLYTPDISPLHRTLAWFGLPVTSLITDPNTALLAIAIADTWQWFPFTMLIILAALQMVPEEPLEAAKIDAATPWQTFRHIVFPFIRPALVLAALFRLIDSVKAFPLIFVLTDGGPGSATQITNYYAYIQAFGFSYLGYASAIAVMLVAGVFVLSMLVSRLDRSDQRAD